MMEVCLPAHMLPSQLNYLSLAAAAYSGEPGQIDHGLDPEEQALLDTEMTGNTDDEALEGIEEEDDGNAHGMLGTTYDSSNDEDETADVLS